MTTSKNDSTPQKEQAFRAGKNEFTNRLIVPHNHKSIRGRASVEELGAVDPRGANIPDGLVIRSSGSLFGCLADECTRAGQGTTDEARSTRISHETMTNPSGSC